MVMTAIVMLLVVGAAYCRSQGGYTHWRCWDCEQREDDLDSIAFVRTTQREKNGPGPKKSEVHFG